MQSRETVSKENRRSDEDAESMVDVVLAGPVFFDIIFTGVDAALAAGTEVWTRGMGSSPGGIANLAVATSRLGLSSSLAATFGDDAYGQWCWDVLSTQEGVDLTSSVRLEATPTPVTVSIAQNGDRSMITNGPEITVTAEQLLGGHVAARAALVDLNGMRGVDVSESWWKRAADRGTRIFADIGWDPTGVWDTRDLDPLASCYAFTPNEREAMAYARADTPLAAARFLADRVPLVVVTCGAEGALAIDSVTGEEARVAAVPARVEDATGAGDVFAASFVVGSLGEWPLAQRLAFAALCSSLAVQEVGGSLGAPGWNEIAGWWTRTRLAGDSELTRRYGFLDDLIPADLPAPARRAAPTFSFPVPPRTA